MVYSTRRFVVCLSVCHFVLVFFSPFTIAITSFGEERSNLSAFRTFVRFVLVWICRFPLPFGVGEELRFVIVTHPGLFSYLILRFVIVTLSGLFAYLFIYLFFNSLLLCGSFYETICFKSCIVFFCSCVFSPFSIAITSLGEEKANLRVFRTFGRLTLLWFCLIISSSSWCLERAAGL